MSNFWNSIGEVAGGNLISAGMGMLTAKHNDQRQLRQQQALNDMQLASNKQMTDYQHNKQLEMWKATSYPAQMEQLKKAGLNPALLYGQGGGGGTTTGASAASVGAPDAPKGGNEIMGMMSASNMALQQAQIRLINAQADKLNSETPTNGNLGDVNYESGKADIANKNLQNNLLKIENKIKEDTMQNAISIVQAEQQNAWRNNDLLTNEVWVRDNIGQAQVTEANARALGAVLTNNEITSRTNLNNEERKSISVKLAQKWTELQIAEKNAETNKDNAKTNKLNQELNNARLEWDKEIHNVSDATKLTVETVGGIAEKLFIGSKMKKTTNFNVSIPKTN